MKSLPMPRHILKSQPKNLRAYRQLGEALAGAARWGEAAGILRRLLGAQPGDFRAHSLLAQACQHIGEFDRAIWHAERALDQQPNDPENQELMRQLYRDQRQEEIERLQLTAGALAQQHIRNNMLQEALDTLAQALERNPERLDLQLLRARALWLDGKRTDAAEVAVEVLDALPYAIDANRIMTDLWLAEGRPSDAQPYLKRIEELDPQLAQQLATGEGTSEALLSMEELDYSSISQREQAIVNPEWLNRLGGDTDEGGADTAGESPGAGLGALFGIEEGATPAVESGIADDLDDLLSDAQIEALFKELVIGEAVAAVSEVEQIEQADEAGEVLQAMEDRGLLSAASAEEDDADIDDDDDPLQLPPELAEDFEDLDDIVSDLDALDEEDSAEDADFNQELDAELASLLEQLDSSEEENDWTAEIQQGSLDSDADDDSLEYLDGFEREWVLPEEDEDAEGAGAPWLSAAMREAIDQDEEGNFDLFGDDEQFQSLLNRAPDTEPLHLSDIEDWLEQEQLEDGPGSEAVDEDQLDIDDEWLHSPPADSWLEDEEAASAGDEDEDPNQLSSELIDSWQAELGDDDDDDDDPYVDWLRDDAADMGDELNRFAAPADAPTIQGSQESAEGEGKSAQETARAWGLDDPGQLADFIDAEAQQSEADGASDWLNAIVPGLDREDDKSTEDEDEYARHIATPGKEFAWVSEIIEEETGEMKAVDIAPAETETSQYFRFNKPPAWLTILQAEQAGGEVVAGITAHSLDELQLDELTFDNYFNFDTPTDKMNVINLDEETQELNFDGLDWDDYFDLESPTEKTIAISLDEEPGAIEFEELGVDDDDFDFESATDKLQAIALDEGEDPFNFDDIGLGEAPGDSDTNTPTWLQLDESGDEDHDPPSGKSSV